VTEVIHGSGWWGREVVVESMEGIRPKDLSSGGLEGGGGEGF